LQGLRPLIEICTEQNKSSRLLFYPAKLQKVYGIKVILKIKSDIWVFYLRWN